MSKIIWLLVIGWVARTVWSAVKKAINQAKAEIEADKARQQQQQQQAAPPAPPKRPEQRDAARAAARSRAPQPVVASAPEDPKAALLRMLAAAGVNPNVTKVVEALARDPNQDLASKVETARWARGSDAARIDYDDDARESGIDYDDDARESRIDYDDDADEDHTDYDDDASESRVDYDDDPPSSPVVWAAPAAPVVYAMPDDHTSSQVNSGVRAEIMSHRSRELPGRARVHGLDAQNIHSKELVRDSVVLDVLLRRYPNNPFFLRRR